VSSQFDVRRAFRAPMVLLGAALCAVLLATSAAAATPTIVHVFDGLDGGNPETGLVQGSDGNFYGTTVQIQDAQGNIQPGSIFRMTPQGVLTTLVTLSNSTATVVGQLIVGADGNLYAATNGGGPQCSVSVPVTVCGAVIKLTLDGAFSILYAFTDASSGSFATSLIQGSDGNFYGTTSRGGDLNCNPQGDPPGCGEVFKLTSAGVLSVVYSFMGAADGGNPYNVIEGSDGNFYGTTNYDTIFKLTSSGTLTTLVTLNGNSIPMAPLVEGPDGNFYGTTVNGGANSAGTIYRITPGGTFTTLYTFGGTATDPGSPTSALIVGSDGNLYGAAPGNLDSNTTVGSVFRISPSGSGYSVLALFSDPAPSGPEGQLLETSDGSLYGTLNTGGNGDLGGVFEMSGVFGAAPAPTVSLSASPTSITQGQSTKLTWSTTNATACTASGAWSGSEAVNGSQSETPTASGTAAYTLTCTGAGGSAQETADVSVSAPAPTVTLSAAPTSLMLGSSTTLTWSTTNATSCSASEGWSGSEQTAGSLTETPGSVGTAVYALTCTGAGGSANASISVKVTPVNVALSAKAGGGGSMGFGTAVALVLLLLARYRRVARCRFGRCGGWVCSVRRGAPCALLLYSASALAQNAGVDFSQGYFGVRAGEGTYDVTPSDLDAALAGDGTTVTSMQQHKGAGVLFAGVPFYRGLSLELGFAWMNEYHVRLLSNSADIAQVAADTLGRLDPAGRGITLGLGGPFDLNSWVAIEPHLGVIAYQSRQEVFAPGATYTRGDYGVGLDAGASLLFKLLPRLYVGAGFECLNTCNVRLISAEVEFHPGR